MRLLCGCAPCQTFSTMNQKDREKRQRDHRWGLLLQFGRLVGEVKPEFVTMENVPGLMKEDVFGEFLNTLADNGYSVSYEVVNCADYGMPQSRHRLVLVGSRLGEIKLLTPEEVGASPTTVREAIGSLNRLKHGATDPLDGLHTASALSEKNTMRIQASKPGGTWRDWDESLALPCHQKSTGDGYGAVYGRMEWDKPSPTITTQFYNYGSGRFGHPEQDRALSLREGAILQGFPTDYEFEDPCEPLGKRALGRLIGNAVPVGLGELVGKTFAKHMELIG